MDRAERTGLGVAVAGHVLLFAALSFTVGAPPAPPAPPPAVEVEFVDGAEVALQAETAPAASQAPELAPEPAEPVAPEPEPIVAPTPEPVVQPAPVPPPAPTPLPKAQPQPRPQPKASPRAQPKAQPKAAPARPAAQSKGQPKAAPASRLGPDFLKGIGTDATPKTSGATLTAASLAGIQQVIANRIQPCANRLHKPGPGAERIRTTLALRLRRDGSLAARPKMTRQAGADESNSQFADRMSDLAIAAVTQCAPLRGLPPELYSTPNGGWASISFTYRHPG